MAWESVLLMKIIRSLDEVGAPSPSVVTVGNFDGVHLGHEAILSVVRDRALKSGLPSVAITFEPHPLARIAPERAPTPISTIDQKIHLIEKSGIDVLLIQEFTKEFSSLTAGEFIGQYLVNGFQTETLCVGHNFRFGHQHRGDIHTLGAWKSKFEVFEVSAVMVGDIPVSSSRIRGQIARGRTREARRLLGRCYEIGGRIVPGQGRGEKLTVPTLNIEPTNELLPADGVYLTRTAVDDETWSPSLTNIGVRPTFPETERTVESHLLDRAPPAGAMRARLRFIGRLRDERRFPSADALKEQIQEDRSRAERFFRRFDTIREVWSDDAPECASQDSA